MSTRPNPKSNRTEHYEIQYQSIGGWVSSLDFPERFDSVEQAKHRLQVCPDECYRTDECYRIVKVIEEVIE